MVLCKQLLQIIKIMSNSKTKKAPPEVKLTLAVKFNEKLPIRPLINIADEANADATIKCSETTEITIERKVRVAEANALADAIDDIRVATSQILAYYMIFKKHYA